MNIDEIVGRAVENFRMFMQWDSKIHVAALEQLEVEVQAAIEKATKDLCEQLRLADAAEQARNHIEGGQPNDDAAMQTESVWPHDHNAKCADPAKIFTVKEPK